MRLPTLREVLEVVIVAVLLFLILTALSSCARGTEYYDASVIITHYNGDFDQQDIVVKSTIGTSTTFYLQEGCLNFHGGFYHKTICCGVRKFKVLKLTKR